MSDRSLDSLSSAFYPKACEIIARCAGRGVAVLIVQTSRTEAEHAVNLANGTSGTSRSKHLPRKLRPQDPRSFMLEPDKADAIDLVPYDQYQLHGPDKLQWDSNDPAFGIIGEECERVGCRWGGRWKSPYDPGHCELVLPSDNGITLAAERARPWPSFTGMSGNEA